MPKLTVEGRSAEVDVDKRLVLAIEELGVQIGHRCGGIARCTTCRVTFVAGEPDTLTEAEYAKLNDAGLYGQYRLSCQIVCSNDMEVVPVMTLENQGWSDTGPAPDPAVKPDPTVFARGDLEARG
jgi:ferredoxin